MSKPSNSWAGSLALLLSAIALAVAGLLYLRDQASTTDVSSLQSAESRLLDREKVVDANASTVEARPRETTPTAKRSLRQTIRLPLDAAPANKEELEAEATFVAKQLTKRMPSEPMALHVEAMLHAQLHATEKAEELWRRCIELDPSTEPYYVNLAAIALDRGDSQLAVDTLRAAEKAGLQSPNISHHLGVALSSVGKAEEAIEVVRESLKTEPNSAAHWLILGQAQLQQGENEEAEQSLRRALALGATTKSAYFSLFNVCMRLGKREEAMKFREAYDRFAESDDLDAQDRYKVLSEAEARRVCISVLSEAAALYRAIPEPQSAEHLLLRVLALDPDNQAACRELIDIYVKGGDLGDELLLRQRITELDPLNLLNYLEMAKAQIAAGRTDGAEASIKYAISLAPQMVTGYAAMTDFLLELGQPKKAQWYIERAIDLKPSPQGYLLLAKTLKAQGDEKAAADAQAKAKQMKAP